MLTNFVARICSVFSVHLPFNKSFNLDKFTGFEKITNNIDIYFSAQTLGGFRY